MLSCCCCMLYPPDKKLTTPYTHLGKTEIYSEMFKECFNITLILDSNRECGICEVCVCRLRGASDFKLQVQRSQAELRARLQGGQDVKVQPSLKSEMPDDASSGDETMLETFDEITIEKTEITGENETHEDPLVKSERLDDDGITEDSLLSECRVKVESEVATDESEGQITETSGIRDGLPEKSKRLYNKTYSNFMDWKSNKKDSSFSEDTLLEYFQHLCRCNKPSTMWTVYSKLKSTIQLYHQEDISRYTKLQAFLKREHYGYKAKQARTFSSEELNRFIDNACDREFLLIKVAAIFGIAGACRRQELHHLLFKDVTDLEKKDTLIVQIRNNKNKIDRTFSITGKYYYVCKKYLTLREHIGNNKPNFFVRYYQGKCSPHNVGINSFGGMGKTVASELRLPNPELYTGHCFRRTSAMFQSINGSNTLLLQDLDK